MLIIKLILSVVLSFSFWLIYGSPDLQMPGNVLIVGCTVLHLLIVIWNKEVFRVFRGDEFTYGMVGVGVNLASFGWTLGAGILVLYSYGKQINSLGMVPSFVWGGLCLGLIGSLLIPMLSTSKISQLPNRESRRDYELPRSD